jgi:hypothetical protein
MDTDLIALIKSSPLYLAVVIITAIAPYVLPAPLGDQKIFGYTFAIGGGIAGVAVGKSIAAAHRVIKIIMILLGLVITAVAYVAMIGAISTPSLLQIVGQALLYTGCFACLFALASLGDIEISKG